MIPQYKFTERAVEILRAVPDLDSLPIVANAPINMNPEQAPWIGVYPENERFTPGRLGVVQAWDRVMSIRAIVQIANSASAADGERQISLYLEKVLGALGNAANWPGFFHLMQEVSVEHAFRVDAADTVLFRESQIVVSGLTVSTI